MSSFSCPICKVIEVINHPGADRLSIVKVLGYTCISGKLEDGSHRYNVGDLCVYIPSASILPEWLLKEMDFWNEEKNMGGLAGSNGDRVKPLRLRGIYSEGVLYPVRQVTFKNKTPTIITFGDIYLINQPEVATGVFRHVETKVADEPIEIPAGFLNNPSIDDINVGVNLGDDVSNLLGITKYEPPIPQAMAGQVSNLFGKTLKYDFENILNYMTTEWSWVPDEEWNGIGEVDSTRPPP